jgi:TPR repeat protein
MFIEVTNRVVDYLHYNIGNLYENGVRKWKNYIFDTDYASANEWYQAASNNGDSRADYRLGMMHECGKHFKRDIATAITYYSKASTNGNVDATYRLACIYINGYGVTPEPLKAFHLFTKASTMGHKNANKEMKIEKVYGRHELYHSSLLTADPKIPVNRKTRLHVLKKATEEGYTRLQYQLGIMYEKDNDYQSAFKWLSLATNIGVTDAYYRVGVFYEEGKGVDQDYVMAAKMYQKAVKKEHEDACYRFGQLYQYGNGVELDYLKAYQFYKKASDLGHVEAYKILNITLKSRIMSIVDAEKNSLDPSSQEYLDSLLMCKCVAENGDTEVQFQLGFAYEHSVLEPNYDEAHKWYSLAAESTHKEAIYHLGLLYEKGLGISRDYQKANELCGRANQQNSDNALYRLGTLYHHGKGVEADPEKAIDYYKRAAEQGNPVYQCELGKLYEDGKLFEKNLLEALKWYPKAYLKGYNDVRQRLYDMYEHELYEDYFFKKILQKLLIASQGYFRLHDSYYYFDCCDINSRIGVLYFFGQGTDKDIRKGWKYFSMKYTDRNREATAFLFLEFNNLCSDQKNEILNAIEEDHTLINQMVEMQLYTFGMHFFEGVLKMRNGYTTLDYYDQDNSSQHIIIEKNYTKALKCLKKAAEKKIPSCYTSTWNYVSLWIWCR